MPDTPQQSPENIEGIIPPSSKQITPKEVEKLASEVRENLNQAAVPDTPSGMPTHPSTRINRNAELSLELRNDSPKSPFLSGDQKEAILNPAIASSDTYVHQLRTIVQAYPIIGQQLDAVRILNRDQITIYECNSKSCGSGGTASVHRGYFFVDDSGCAKELVKKFPLKREHISSFQHEALIHHGLREIFRDQLPHCVIAICGDEHGIYMPFIPGEKLDSSEKPLQDKWKAMVQVIGVVHRLHQEGVIHRDIKPGNIMIDESCQGHLIDMTLAGVISDKHSIFTQLGIQEACGIRNGEISGTPGYFDAKMFVEQDELGISDVSTEMRKQRCKNIEWDVLSCAIILLELLDTIDTQKLLNKWRIPEGCEYLYFEKLRDQILSTIDFSERSSDGILERFFCLCRINILSIFDDVMHQPETRKKHIEEYQQKFAVSVRDWLAELIAVCDNPQLQRIIFASYPLSS